MNRSLPVAICQCLTSFARTFAGMLSTPKLVSALGFAWDRTSFYELLNLNDELYRVFVEAVICDFCGHRAVASATPGVMEIYWGAEDETKARERCFSLPRLSCSACKKLLERRSTVWQVN